MRLRISLVIALMGLMMADPVSAQNRFGFFGGLNIASQGGDMEEVGDELAREFQIQFNGTWESETSSSTGFGAGFSYFVETSETFGIQVEGQYIQRGSKIQTAGQDITTGGLPPSLVVTTTFKLKYLEIPILARYSPSPDAKVRPVFLGGFDIGVKTGADLEVEVSGSSQSQDMSSGYEDFTFGALLGVGMDVQTGKTAHLLVQARYYLGLTDPIDDPTIQAKSGDLGFFVGFEFDLRPTARGGKETPKL